MIALQADTRFEVRLSATPEVVLQGTPLVACFVLCYVLPVHPAASYSGRLRAGWAGCLLETSASKLRKLRYGYRLAHPML